MFILLVGPKGSGKSHIGRMLEKHLGVLFFHVEPLWMSYYAECEACGREPVISEGITKVHPLLADTLRTHEHVCIETTGASAEILDDLLSLTHPSNRLVVRISAPLELCLERIVARDQTNQIAMDAESIQQVYALSQVGRLQPDFAIENVQLSEAEIVSLFKRALARQSGGQARQAGSAETQVLR
jgi:dephospho-CoA kinase